MSRIDQALRIWEGRTGAEASEGGAIQTSRSSVLHQYLHEEPNLQPPQRPPSRRPLEVTLPVEVKLPAETQFSAKAKLPVVKPGNADSQARLVTAATSTVSIEQYRRLAAVLHEEQIQRQLKTVMITSALPQEGKTLTLVNLALTLSESYARRVLMIDADLRKPSLQTVLAVPNGRGLSEALRGDQWELPFVEVSSRLRVLTAGHPGPTPLAGLTSKRMEEVIEACVAQFDWVLIDTSPVGLLPDAQVLARLVGAVIFVIAAGSTPADAVRRALGELDADSIIGTVLNRVEERRIPEAGYYSYKTIDEKA